ncbi:hypothetical protein HOLleu_18675 [Holothuria leucospilota]|uniref:Uncharacterized protein n=1 Tax=Holothuria leucospilota TaxID=206669 RepID=A0A9Q1C4I8_HOLLE|nr:hypothetical protein HOLleu_18675 [Holothuria leucospilota]
MISWSLYLQILDCGSEKVESKLNAEKSETLDTDNNSCQISQSDRIPVIKYQKVISESQRTPNPQTKK